MWPPFLNSRLPARSLDYLLSIVTAGNDLDNPQTPKIDRIAWLTVLSNKVQFIRIVEKQAGEIFSVHRKIGQKGNESTNG